jgi:PAS domain S-box-containing protein
LSTLPTIDNRQMKQLRFVHLPGFAQFLLDNKLDELVKKQLEFSREVNLPLLKVLEALPKEQLAELSKTSTAELLQFASANNLDEQIELSLKQWTQNLLPFMKREQVVADDITLSSMIRKKSLLHFLPQYTIDVTQVFPLIGEIDEYLQASESALFTTFLDIQREELQQAIEKLRRSEDRYQNMVLEVEDYAIIRLSPDGIVENWNRGAEKIKGYKGEEIIGKSFRTFYTPADRASNLPDKLLQEARTNGRAINEGWRVRKDGTKFWGSITITALHNEKNEVVGFTKVTRDLTERKAAEAELAEKSEQLAIANEALEQKNSELERSNKELSSFSYVASHDLQEPLRKIMMFGQMLAERDQDKLSEKGKDMLAKIQAGAVNMKRLIEDLLSFSRLQSYSQTTEEVDLNEIINQIKAAYADTSPRASIQIRAQHLPAISGISFQLNQLFENIISNSVKYAKPNVPPQIDITSQIVGGREIRQEGAEQNSAYHKITLSDNGIGFEQQYATRIFEIFQRLHKKQDYAGTGIGLAICKRIVQNHKGFIEAKGVPDVGASFIVYLPV